MDGVLTAVKQVLYPKIKYKKASVSIYSPTCKRKNIFETIVPFIIYINNQSFLFQISVSSMELPFASTQKILLIYAALKGKIGSNPGFYSSLFFNNLYCVVGCVVPECDHMIVVFVAKDGERSG